ncbi:MAG: type III secretion T3S chaperone [Verrucomicrobiota bacterium]|nr:type III secretion T3S chaperone [Verrucomicrobiota bacterium]
MIHYPLEEVLTIKKNRFDAATKILQEKKTLLEKARQELQKRLEEKEKARLHRAEKLAGLRETMSKEGTVKEIEQGELYLKLATETLAEKERKVVEQEKVVAGAEKQLEAATAEMLIKKREWEKMQLHKEEWMKEAHFEEARKEEKERDEEGATLYTTRKRKEGKQ